MSHYPLFFTYRDRLFGSGFLAEVTSHGRILCALEDGEFWVYGVQPGGIAATGASTKEALDAYRESFTNVLRDFAADSGSFDEFKGAVEQFFAEISEPTQADWLQAVDQVRNANSEIPDLRREHADAACYVNVELKHQASFSPKDNKPAEMDASLAIPDTKAA